jgi:hypothetical protein
MEVKLKLTSDEHKELVSYCNLNDLLISSVVKDSFTTGFNIERYGLLNTGGEIQEKIIEKEVIKYVEIPVVQEKEVVKIEYVEVEKLVEVIKEVPVEKEVVVEKEINDESLKPKIEALQNTVQKLKQDNIDKDRKIKEYEKTIQEIQMIQDRQAVYLRGSNLDNKLNK